MLLWTWLLVSIHQCLGCPPVSLWCSWHERDALLQLILRGCCLYLFELVLVRYDINPNRRNGNKFIFSKLFFPLLKLCDSWTSRSCQAFTRRLKFPADTFVPQRARAWMLVGQASKIRLWDWPEEWSELGENRRGIRLKSETSCRILNQEMFPGFSNFLCDSDDLTNSHICLFGNGRWQIFVFDYNMWSSWLEAWPSPGQKSAGHPHRCTFLGPFRITHHPTALPQQQFAEFSGAS